MLLMQAYAEAERRKRKDLGEEEKGGPVPFGMTVSQSKPAELLKADEHFVSLMSTVEKMLSKKDVAEFMSTLTPGAQNAIYASSFIWGYENASRYLKNTMKLAEVKNAADSEEKSKVVIENMQKQAEGHTQSNKEASTFVWGYYNEDLKDSQAMSGVSETLTQKEKDEEKERQTQMQMKIPTSAPEAVAQSVMQNSANPALAYCATAQQEADKQMQARAIEVKREEVARLVEVKGLRAAADAQEKKSDDALEVAVGRKKELEEEYLKLEKEITGAIDKLDMLSRDDKDQVNKVAAMLPSELARYLRRREKSFAKRVQLRKQLARWLASAKSGRKGIASMPLDKLKRLVNLTSLFR
jgi:hypothetical protein